MSVLRASFTTGKPLLMEGVRSRRRLKPGPPREGVLKFNVDGAARGKPGLGGIGGGGGVLRNSLEDVLEMYLLALQTKFHCQNICHIVLCLCSDLMVTINLLGKTIESPLCYFHIMDLIIYLINKINPIN